MRYLRLYADAAGESHFEDVTVDMRQVEYVPWEATDRPIYPAIRDRRTIWPSPCGLAG